MLTHSDDEEGGNGSSEGCIACRFDIQEIKMLTQTNCVALSRLTEVLDERVSELITLLDKRLDAPWIAMSRMLIILSVVVLAFIGSVFVSEHGIKATETLVETLRK